MLKQISRIAAVILVGGCASVDKNTIDRLQVAILYAQGVSGIVSTFVTKYDQRPVCGTIPAPGRPCKDLIRAEVAKKASAALKLGISNAQNTLTDIANSGVNPTTIIAALTSAAIDAFDIVTMFETSNPPTLEGTY